MIVLSIIGILVAIIVYLLILKLINKLIFKNNSKINLKEIIISWCVIFLINFCIVLADIPFAIGIPINPYFDGGSNTYYYSLGYIIHIENPSIRAATDEGDESYPKVEFALPGFER